MARSKTERAELRRFGILVAIASIAWFVVGQLHSEGVAMALQDTPATKNGWLFLGWLVGGPPYALAVLLWFERRRFTPGGRLFWAVVLAVWIGMSFYILPARIVGPSEHFGTAALVGFPLSFGWVWGIFANGMLAAAVGIGVLVLSMTVEPARARAFLLSRTMRTIIERTWLVLLLVGLWIALYGGDGEGIFNNGI